MQYPLDFNPEDHGFVTFFARGGGASNIDITLYSPPSFAVGDGASYGNFDMGIIAGDVINALSASDTDASIAALGEALGKQSQGADGKVLMAQTFQNFGMGGGALSRAADIYKVKNKKAVNPNTVLQFSNSEIRAYSFEFTLIANSNNESKAIRKIIESFRRHMYPEGKDLFLNYPSIWDISFNKPGGGKNKFIPGIYESYLTSMATTYGTTSNTTHYDGAPVSITVQLSFRETKALKRADIDKLADSSYAGGGRNSRGRR